MVQNKMAERDFSRKRAKLYYDMIFIEAQWLENTF